MTEAAEIVKRLDNSMASKLRRLDCLHKPLGWWEPDVIIEMIECLDDIAKRHGYQLDDFNNEVALKIAFEYETSLQKFKWYVPPTNEDI